MKQLLFLSIMLLTLGAHAQTKLIFHKSHSGDMATFEEALIQDEALDLSNFGMAPTPDVKNARLDSLIYTSDTTIIMVTSKYCTTRGGNYTPYYQGKYPWKPGRAILKNHEFSNYKNKTQELRQYIDDNYNFKNEASSVVIIDTKQPSQKNKVKKRKTLRKKKSRKKEKKKSILPVSQHNRPNTPPSILSLVLVVGLVSIGMGLLYHWLQPQSKKY